MNNKIFFSLLILMSLISSFYCNWMDNGVIVYAVDRKFRSVGDLFECNSTISCSNVLCKALIQPKASLAVVMAIYEPKC